MRNKGFNEDNWLETSCFFPIHTASWEKISLNRTLSSLVSCSLVQSGKFNQLSVKTIVKIAKTRRWLFQEEHC